jgi:hypothetical protein
MDAQATGEAFGPQKRTSSTSKHEKKNSRIFGSFLTPGSGPATQINTDPDPQP